MFLVDLCFHFSQKYTQEQNCWVICKCVGHLEELPDCFAKWLRCLHPHQRCKMLQLLHVLTNTSIVFFITEHPPPGNNNQFINFFTSTWCLSDTESQPLYTGTELYLRERVWVK